MILHMLIHKENQHFQGVSYFLKKALLQYFLKEVRGPHLHIIYCFSGKENILRTFVISVV